MSSPISGFTAIPNPQMLAFMPIQSYLMMYFAGSGWQYGKRKISAMSNEQFNKLTPEQLLQQHTLELKNMIPTLERSLNDVTPLVRILIEQYGDFIKEALNAVPHALEHAGIPILTGQAKTDYDKAFFDWLKGNPETNIPSSLQAGAELSTIETHTSSEFRDTSGMTLAQHEANKAAEAARLVAARANRPSAIQKFGSTKITAQVRADVSKRPAGQSAKLERLQLTHQIQASGKLVSSLSSRKNPQQRRDYDRAKKTLQANQQKLTNLLARYRF